MSFYIVSLCATEASNATNAPTRVGGRLVDMADYPATLGSKTRQVYFKADIQKTSGATNVQVSLEDVTQNVTVTNSTLTSTSNANTSVTSVELLVGSASGNLRSDSPSQYEVRLLMNGGGANDAVFCTNARLVIMYV